MCAAARGRAKVRQDAAIRAGFCPSPTSAERAAKRIDPPAKRRARKSEFQMFFGKHSFVKNTHNFNLVAYLAKVNDVAALPDST